MFLMILDSIEQCVKKYTSAYRFGNNQDLDVELIANINDENKECLLNDIDLNLPYGLNFSHIYENGKLKVTFKELI